MKFTMTKVTAGILLAVAASGAQAVTVSSASVTGGNFEMIGFGAPITFSNFGTGSTNILGYDGTTPGRLSPILLLARTGSLALDSARAPLV